MNIKTFVYDVRGFSSGLAARIDADYSTWHTATSPTAVTAVSSSISADTLVVTIHYTA